MYQMVYDHHFSHSIIHITAISSFTPSSAACPVGVQFLPWMRGGSAVSSSTATYCGMLLWSREHRSCKTMHIPSIDQLPRWGSRVLTVSFPSPAQQLNLCMICEEKYHYEVHLDSTSLSSRLRTNAVIRARPSLCSFLISFSSLRLSSSLLSVIFKKFRYTQSQPKPGKKYSDPIFSLSRLSH